MQKVVDLYRGDQGTCTVLLERTAMLTHSSTGIWILKGKNERLLEGCAWIGYLSLPCLSVERKSSNSSTGAMQLCRVYPSRAPPILLEQRQLPEPGQPLPVWPQEAVREPRWALAPARCRSEMQSKYETRHCFHGTATAHPRLHPAVSVCLQLLSDAFSAGNGLSYLLWAPEQPKQGTAKKTQTTNSCFMTPHSSVCARGEIRVEHLPCESWGCSARREDCVGTSLQPSCIWRDPTQKLERDSPRTVVTG